MGCKGPKSSLRILKNELTFLDCKVRQIEELNREFGCDVPLVLMNSFNTHEETLAVMEKYKKNKVSIYNFIQSKFPMMYRDTLDLVPSTATDKKS
jgi:UTP--glucose-1-phosphate uridylyltransferase